MIVRKVIDYLENNGISTTDNLARALGIDRDTVMMIMQSLSKSKVIKIINNTHSCCDTRTSCNSCNVLTSDYYTLY